MRFWVTVLMTMMAIFLVACGSEADGTDTESAVTAEEPTGAFAADQSGASSETLTALADVVNAEDGAAAKVAADAAEIFETGDPQFADQFTQQLNQRRVISSAFVSVEVEDVQAAIVRIRTIAEDSGGFLEHLSSSGEPDRQRASMTIRVPQDQLTSALARIDGLGVVQSRTLGSEDVSEEFVDLEARIRSSLREEESLLSLLERAGEVGDVLAIERELFRVRADIERLQGRLDFLNGRVNLATISVLLTSPELYLGEPPSANLTIVVSDVSDSTDDIKGLTSTLGGVVDRVFLSQREDREEAQITIRVFSSDFEPAVAFLESQGDVTNKEVVEGIAPADETAEPPDKPDSYITLFLESGDGPVNVLLIIAIAVPVGLIVLAAIVALIFTSVYGAGRRSGRGF